MLPIDDTIEVDFLLGITYFGVFVLNGSTCILWMFFWDKLREQ